MVNIQKYLIVAPAWVGDMVMAQSLFRLIKQQNEQACIDVIAPSSTFKLLQFMPEVHRAILIDAKHGKFDFFKRFRLGRSLRHEKYHHAIVLPNSWKSALVPFFANIPHRTGWCGEKRYGLLNDVRVLNKAALPLMVERFLALGLKPNELLKKPYLLPYFQVNDTQLTHCLSAFKLNVQQSIIALCPGAAYGPSKRWPPTYFAAVAEKKVQEGYQVWIIGAPSDQSAAEKIQSIVPQCVNLTGKTNLAQAICLLSAASYVVTNDSGLMHIACALDRRVIAIYGSSSPEFTPPLSDKAKVLWLHIECSPCFQRECPLKHWRCMRELTPDKVLTAFE